VPQPRHHITKTTPAAHPPPPPPRHTDLERLAELGQRVGRLRAQLLVGGDALAQLQLEEARAVPLLGELARQRVALQRARAREACLRDVARLQRCQLALLVAQVAPRIVPHALQRSRFAAWREGLLLVLVRWPGRARREVAAAAAAAAAI
jgi:hypothetical protein